MLLPSVEAEYFFNLLNLLYIAGKCELSPFLILEAEMEESKNDTVDFLSFHTKNLPV